MIKNYLKIAFRNLVKNKVHSAINIAGLSVGMAVAILIGLWIYDELSFDGNNQDRGRIAQVIQNVSNNGDKQTWFQVPFPLAAALRKSYSGDFKYVVNATGNWQHVLSFGDKKLTKSGPFMEPNGPEMLHLKMLKGSLNGLKDPSSILLSAASAKAYFGDADPMNKLMKIDNKLNVKVAGVYEDMPHNSSFADAAFFAPWELFYNDAGLKNNKNPWRPNAFTLYVQLADNAQMESVSAKIKDVKMHNVNKDELYHKPQLFLHPMSRWHLHSEFKNGVNTGGGIQYVWMFGIIGLFVLLLACINFMNLSTARSEKRAKEVGIRKAIGSLRSQLIYQFFSESLLVVVLSLVLSLVLVMLALPLFNLVADKQVGILWSSPMFWLIGIAFCLITGIVAGSYPALYLSSFEPVKVLKGTFRVGRFASLPRKVLVVIQFTVSVTLIIGTVIIFRQIQFAKNRPIGYSRDGLLIFPMATADIHNHYATVKDELLKTGAVAGVAESASAVTQINGTNSGFDWPGKDPGLAVDFPNTDVATEYGKTVGWQFKDGRDFSAAFLTDSSAFVINEAAAKYMGLKHPVGETVKWDGKPFKIIGVIKDMIMESPYDAVRPSFFHLLQGAGNYVIIKINPRVSAREALDKIQPVFKTYNPSQPFDYQFADDEYAKKFGNEERVGKLAGFFASLAIFISCLGLFGMASFMAEQRTKEIGVRKVLGASVFNLWRMLSKDFVILVIVSLVIATPTAYYFMHKWLQNYQYRSDMAWWVFALAGTGALVITLLTVSYQSLKASLMNPVKSLRSE